MSLLHKKNTSEIIISKESLRKINRNYFVIEHNNNLEEGNYYALNFSQYWSIENKLSIKKLFLFNFVEVKKNVLEFPFVNSILHDNSKFIGSKLNINLVDKIINLFINALTLKSNSLIDTNIKLILEKDENSYENYREIIKYFLPTTTENLLDLVINDRASYFFNEINKLKEGITKNILLGIVSCLSNNKDDAINFINKAKESLNEVNDVILRQYLNEVKNYCEITYNKTNDNILVIVDESESYLEKGSILYNNYESLFYKRTTEFKMFSGVEREVINYIKTIEWNILILLGHGDANGYTILNKDKNKEKLTKNDLEKLNNNFEGIIIDTTCSNNHFYTLIEKFQKLEIIGNVSTESTFNTASAYFFLLGYLCGNNEDSSFEYGLLSMSLFSKEEIDTIERSKKQ